LAGRNIGSIHLGETVMTGKTIKYGLVGLVAAATLGMAVSQAAIPQQGRWYSFHIPARGTCPGLDFHAVLDENNAVTGFVAWDRMKHMGALSGQVNPDNTFTNTVTESGGRTATITGKVTNTYLTISIDGTGTGCDKQTFRIRRAIDSGEIGGG
jgi:hypothetical protein